MFPESIFEETVAEQRLAEEFEPDTVESMASPVEKIVPAKPAPDTVPLRNWLSEKQLFILGEATGLSSNALQDVLDQADTTEAFAHFLGLKNAEALSYFFTLSAPAQKLFGCLNFNLTVKPLVSDTDLPVKPVQLELEIRMQAPAPAVPGNADERAHDDTDATNDAPTCTADGDDDANYCLQQTNTTNPADTETVMPDTAAMLQPEPPAGGGGGAVEGQPVIVVPPAGNRVISLDGPESPRSGPDIESAGESIGSRASEIRDAELSDASYVERPPPQESPVMSEGGDLPSIIEHPEESPSGQAAGDGNISAGDFENVANYPRDVPHEGASHRTGHGSSNAFDVDAGAMNRLANIVGPVPANPILPLVPVTNIALNPSELAMVVGGLTVIALSVITYEVVTIANSDDTTQADPVPPSPSDTTAPAHLDAQDRTIADGSGLPAESVLNMPVESTTAPVASLMLEFALRGASAAGTSVDDNVELIPGLRTGLGLWIALQPSEHVLSLAGFDLLPDAGDRAKALVYLDVGNASPTSSPLSTDNLFSLIASMRSFCEQRHSDAPFEMQFDFLGLDMIAGSLLESPMNADMPGETASGADSSTSELLTLDAAAAELVLTGLAPNV